MLTVVCHKCKQVTAPIYRPSKDLPFDWDAGFFCQYCNLQRLNTDEITASLIDRLNEFEKLVEELKSTA